MNDRCPVCLLPVEPAEREREAIRLVGESDYRRLRTAWRCMGCDLWVWNDLKAAAVSEAAAAGDG